MSEKTFPTIGYWRSEQRTFHLREGETLPKGWFNTASKAATRSSGASPPGDAPAVIEGMQPKKRGRPRKSQETEGSARSAEFRHETDEEPAAELASEVGDYPRSELGD